MKRPYRSAIAVMCAVSWAILTAQTLPAGVGTEHADGLRLVAHDGLQARQTYQIAIHRQGDKHYLYAGHMRGTEKDPATGKPSPNGTSVLDITDPARPRYIRHIGPTPAPWFTGNAEDSTGGQHVQVCAGADLPKGKAGRFYVLRNHGMIAQEILDVTDPAKPRFITDVVRTAPTRDGRLRTHKNVWDCKTGQAYLVDSVAGWTGQILQLFDLSDPERPRHVRDFGLPGSQPGGDAALDAGFSLHEASVLGDRVYLAYGTNHHGVIQILDRTRLWNGEPGASDPLMPNAASLAYPQIARMNMPTFWGGHSAKPILDVPIADYARNKQGARRNFLFVTSEGIDFRCATPRHISFFVDITDEKHPWPVSNFQVPALPQKPDDPDFCERGVFGPHSPHASHSPLYEGRLLFLSYFTGGLRVVDMRDPFKPVEVGRFMASTTPASRVIYPPDAGRDVKPWPVANTVEIDERGRYVYVADRPHNGLYVLELTGALKAIADEGTQPGGGK